MWKALFVLIIGSLAMTNAFGQNDSLKNEILKYQDQKSLIISNGRKMTLDNFIADDKKKVADLLDLLTKEENNDYLALYPSEKWLLCYWTFQFQNIINYVSSYDSSRVRTLNMQIKPARDLLLIRLKEKLFLQRDEIKKQILKTELSEVDKQFLMLNLDYLLTNYSNGQITQDTLNVYSNKFLQNYSTSQFNTFIRQYIKYEISPSKWGMGFELFTGYGMFTKKLRNNFKNNISFGVAFDIYYKNLTLYLRDYIGISKTKDSIPFSGGTWQKGAQVDVVMPEASLGYMIFENRFFKVTPFTGVSSTDISPTDHDKKQYPQYEKVGLKFTTTYTLGVNFDLKLTKNSNYSFPFIRIRYAYNKPQFNHIYNGFNGDFHYVTIGIGVSSRREIRRY